MKACRKCGLEKPVAEFYVSEPRQCKECIKARVRANRADKIDYYRAYDRLRFYENGARGVASVEARRRGGQAYLSRNAEKRSAHIAVGNAVRSRRLPKPDKCEACGCSGRLHGHHDDYSKPLDVRWLCSRCHRAWHRKYDEAETRALVEQHRNSA